MCSACCNHQDAQRLSVAGLNPPWARWPPPVADRPHHACLDQLNAFKSLYEEAGGELIVEWDELVHHYRASGRAVTEGKMASQW